MKKIFIFGFLFCIFLFANCCYAQDYIVSLKDTDAREIMEEITSPSAISLMSAENNQGEILSEKLNLIIVSEEKARELMRQGKTEYIEPDYESELFADSYNDTYFSNQSYFNTSSIEALKEVSNRGRGVRVGLLDSGIYREHEDFQGANIETGYNFVKNTTDTSDLDNHGTAVGGIIAAQDNNGKGVAGIAPEATIVPLVINSDGVGNVSHLVRAIMAAADEYDCKIINISAGTKADSSNAMRDAVAYAVDKGIIVVAAVGNAGDETIYYPAYFSDVIGVGSVDTSGNIAYYSERNTTVDVVVQGSSIYVLNSAGGYSSRNGTSFSAPIVTGMLTLLLSIDETITPEQMNGYIKKAAVDRGDLGYDTSYGYGILKGDELYRAYLDDSIVYINNSENTYKFYSEQVGSFYVFYGVFNNGVYKYGEYRELSTVDYTASDVFEYVPSSGDEVKVTAFESFDTLKLYGYL